MTFVEQALDALTDDDLFETLCHSVLTNAGYPVDPRGGSGDRGRDAIQLSSATDGAKTVFQYSIEQDSRKKLRAELERYQTASAPKKYVYVTSRSVSATAKDDLIQMYAAVGIDLLILDRAWLAAQLNKENNKTIREELLGKYIIKIPDLLRVMFASPAAAATFAVLQPHMDGILIDEKLRVANSLLEAGKNAEAKSEFDAIEQLGTLNDQQKRILLNNRANASMKRGLVGDAKADWKRAVDLSTHDQTPAANLANCALLVDKDAALAQLITETALKAEPKNPKLLNIAGMLALDRRDLPKAAALFNEAFTIERLPEFLLNGWVAREDDGETITEEEIDKALANWSRHPTLLLRKSNYLIQRFQLTHKTEDLKAAQETLVGLISREWPDLLSREKPVSISPLDIDVASLALNSYAGTLYWDRQIDKAAFFIRRSLEIDRSGDLLFSLGQILAGAANYAEAIEAYESAIKAGKTDATVFCQLGTACLGLFGRTRQMELFEKALAAFEKAAEENVEMLVNAAAAIHNVIGDTDRAVRLLNRVIAEKPDSTVAKVNLTNFTSPDHTTAIKTLIDLEQQNPPEIFTVQAAIGDHAFDMGDWPTAQLYYRRVISRPLPFAYLLERVYQRSAECEERIVRGEAGRASALRLALEGIERFPDSELLKRFLTELSK